MGYAILFIFIVLLHPRYCIHINVWVLLHLLCFYSLHTLISLFTSLHFSFFYYPSLLHLFTPLSLLSFTSVLLSPFSPSPLYSSLPSLLHLCTPFSLLSFTSILFSLTAGYPSEAFVRSETVFLALGNAVPEGKAAYVLIR
jgi:hypothetical protein